MFKVKLMFIGSENWIHDQARYRTTWVMSPKKPKVGRMLSGGIVVGVIEEKKGLPGRKASCFLHDEIAPDDTALACFEHFLSDQ